MLNCAVRREKIACKPPQDQQQHQAKHIMCLYVCCVVVVVAFLALFSHAHHLFTWIAPLKCIFFTCAYVHMCMYLYICTCNMQQRRQHHCCRCCCYFLCIFRSFWVFFYLTFALIFVFSHSSYSSFTSFVFILICCCCVFFLQLKHLLESLPIAQRL